jgi:hypothetical protein
VLLLLGSPGLTGSKAADANKVSLVGKLVVGYQGWFGCRGDFGAGLNHWESDGKPTVDMLPDVSELAAADTCPSGWTDASGSPVAVFSSMNPHVVDLHFHWMQQYGLDTAAVQRFVSAIRTPQGLHFTDAVLANVRAAAEAHDRGFFVMYDLTGTKPEDMTLVQRDWDRLVHNGLTTSSMYQRHRGHPLVALWGIGFAGRPLTPDSAMGLIGALRVLDPGVSIMLGVPTYWRSGTGDASANPGWQAVYRSADVISPWTVGRYDDDAGADRYGRNVMAPDLRWARAAHVDLLPVVFPGFSRANLMTARHEPERAIRNQIPRRCGGFLRHQLDSVLQSGATAVYVAMFDEVDEGTAIFKVRRQGIDTPGVGSFISVDQDHCDAASDLYLTIVGHAATRIHQAVP